MGTDPASVSRVTADVLLEFLEVAFHSILYSRELYPASVFDTTHKYNVPVQMCRHQGVRQYIQSVLTSVSTVLEKGQLEEVVFVILDSSRAPIQRFVFELVLPETKVGSSDDLCLSKLEQELRGFILKINTCDAHLTSLPSDSTWTVQVHTSQVAALEMQQRQCVQDFMWIPADDCELSIEDRQIIPLKAVTCEAIKCSLHECAAEEWNLKLSRRFQASWGHTGQQFPCFVNPYDVTTVIFTRTSTPLAIHAIFWPMLCLCTGAAVWLGLCVGCWRIEVDQNEYRVHAYGLPTRETIILR